MDEYVIVNKSDLTSMADTIREALGSTENIAVSDLSSKLVESIETGGSNLTFKTGSFILSQDINTYGQYFSGGIGTIDDLGITIQHNLGVIPRIGLLMCKTRFGGTASVETIESAFVYENDGIYHQFVQTYYSASPTKFLTSNQPITLAKNSLLETSKGCFLAATENDIFITGGGNLAGCLLKGGYEYIWVFVG